MSSRLLKLSILMFFVVGLSAYIFFNQNLFAPRADQVSFNASEYAAHFITPTPSTSFPPYIPPPSIAPDPHDTSCRYINNILPSNCQTPITVTPSTQATTAPASPSPTATSLPNHDPSPSVIPTDCRYVNNILPSNCPVSRISPSPTTATSPTPAVSVSPTPNTIPSPSCAIVFHDTVQSSTPEPARPWWAVFWWWRPRQPVPIPTCPTSQLTPTPRTTAPPTDFPTDLPVERCDITYAKKNWIGSFFSFFTQIFSRNQTSNSSSSCPTPSPRSTPEEETSPSPESSIATSPENEPTDKISFTINLGPTRNKDIIFNSSHKARLFIYDNDRYARTFSASAGSRAKQNSDGTWTVTFKPSDIRSSAKSIPTGNYCAEIEYKFDPNGKTYESGYRAARYLTHTDREIAGGERGVFLYVSNSGDKRVNGLEFNEPIGQRNVFCPTN